jgi:hypothetical protein
MKLTTILSSLQAQSMLPARATKLVTLPSLTALTTLAARSSLTALSTILALAALAGCSAYPKTAADFGNSVRHMVSSQTVTPSKPVDTAPVETGDGERVAHVLEDYRTGAKSAQDLDQAQVSFDSDSSPSN